MDDIDSKNIYSGLVVGNTWTDKTFSLDQDHIDSPILV